MADSRTKRRRRPHTSLAPLLRTARLVPPTLHFPASSLPFCHATNISEGGAGFISAGRIACVPVPFTVLDDVVISRGKAAQCSTLALSVCFCSLISFGVWFSSRRFANSTLPFCSSSSCAPVTASTSRTRPRPTSHMFVYSIEILYYGPRAVRHTSYLFRLYFAGPRAVDRRLSPDRTCHNSTYLLALPVPSASPPSGAR